MWLCDLSSIDIRALVSDLPRESERFYVCGELETMVAKWWRHWHAVEGPKTWKLPEAFVGVRREKNLFKINVSIVLLICWFRPNFNWPISIINNFLCPFCVLAFSCEASCVSLFTTFHVYICVNVLGVVLFHTWNSQACFIFKIFNRLFFCFILEPEEASTCPPTTLNFTHADAIEDLLKVSAA